MKEYRQNAHVRSLVVWAVLCVVVAVILFDPSGKYLERELRWVEIVGGVLLLIVGPVGLAIYLIRVETHWVSVDSERGGLATLSHYHHSLGSSAGNLAHLFCVHPTGDCACD